MMVRTIIELQAAFTKDGLVQDPESTACSEIKCVLQSIKGSVSTDVTSETQNKVLPECACGDGHARLQDEVRVRQHEQTPSQRHSQRAQGRLPHSRRGTWCKGVTLFEKLVFYRLSELEADQGWKSGSIHSCGTPCGTVTSSIRSRLLSDIRSCGTICGIVTLSPCSRFVSEIRSCAHLVAL